jgi:3-oxoacyl-[acyl-carrier-protein] synthase II
LSSLEEQIDVLNQKGERRVSPFLVPMMMANSGGAAVSMRYGLQGPCENTVTACAAGTHSLGNGARMIKDGRCDLVLAGGSEAACTPISLATFGNMTALTTAGISRPFDVDRDGFVIAEGAAVLVLEEWSVAEGRGATILAEVLGSASTADAHHITAPAPGGEGAIRCMRLALEDAGLQAADITQINAHGTSTPLNDKAEAQAVAEVFGTPGPPITSIKGVTGHSLGAAGAIEGVAVVMSMQHRKIPPTLGFEHADPELPVLDLVTEPRSWEPGPTISNSFGFGGHNGSVIFAPAP